jgi:hypothetical protein
MIEEIVKAKLEILTSKIKERDAEILITENILITDEDPKNRHKFPIRGSLSYEIPRPSYTTTGHKRNHPLEKSSFLLCKSQDNTLLLAKSLDINSLEGDLSGNTTNEKVFEL